MFAKYMGSNSFDMLIMILHTKSNNNPNGPVVISKHVQGLLKMGQAKENRVGFWGKVRFSVPTFDSNRVYKPYIIGTQRGTW